MNKQNAIIPFSGFYGTHHYDKVESALESMFCDWEGDGEVWGDLYTHKIPFIDIYASYVTHYADELCSNLRTLLAREGYEVKLDMLEPKLWSPREYNFTNDAIDVNISDDDLLVLFNAMYSLAEQQMTEVCVDRHTSRDGLRSFYRPVWQTWDDDVTKWQPPQIESMIIALCQALDIDYDDYDFIGSETVNHVVENVEFTAHTMDEYNAWLALLHPVVESIDSEENQS